MGCEEQHGHAVWCAPSCPLCTVWLHKLLQALLSPLVQEPKPRVLMVVLQEEGCLLHMQFFCARVWIPCLCHPSSPLDLSACGWTGRSKACPSAWQELLWGSRDQKASVNAVAPAGASPPQSSPGAVVRHGGTSLRYL